MASSMHSAALGGTFWAEGGDGGGCEDVLFSRLPHLCGEAFHVIPPNVLCRTAAPKTHAGV